MRNDIEIGWDIMRAFHDKIWQAYKNVSIGDLHGDQFPESFEKISRKEI